MNYRNIDDLIKEIQSAKIIGIDGFDGSGKTYLSHEIGKKLNIPVLNLDDYLIKGKESYVEHLKYKEISEFIEKNKNSFIIEGVCLLDVLKKLHLDLDCLIYIKLLDEDGVWRAEEECDIRAFNDGVL
jgi:uridine kinase